VKPAKSGDLFEGGSLFYSK